MREMLYSESSSPDVTPAALEDLIGRAKTEARLPPYDQAVEVADDVLKKLKTIEADPNGFLFKAWDAPDATIDSLKQAIGVSMRIGHLIETDQSVVTARDMVHTWSEYSWDPNKKLYNAWNGPGRTYEGLSKAIALARRFGGGLLSERYIETAEQMLSKMQKPVALLEGPVAPWGGPLSFLFRSMSRHNEREPPGCDCPCAGFQQAPVFAFSATPSPLEAVDRTFENIIEQKVVSSWSR